MKFVQLLLKMSLQITDSYLTEVGEAQIEAQNRNFAPYKIIAFCAKRRQFALSEFACLENVISPQLRNLCSLTLL